jgi:hypothetical protein
VITGQAEAGSTVTVNGVAATVAADGTYTATIPTASLPAQDGPFAVNVATTDAAGNTATATQTLTLDRGTTVAITGVEGGDNTINAAEAAGGIVITGTAEAGSPCCQRCGRDVAATAPTPPPCRLRPRTARSRSPSQHGCGGELPRRHPHSDVDRGTAVTITGVEAAVSPPPTPRSTPRKPRDGIVITGQAEAGSTVTVNGVAATVAADGTYTARSRPRACRLRTARLRSTSRPRMRRATPRPRPRP